MTRAHFLIQPAKQSGKSVLAYLLYNLYLYLQEDVFVLDFDSDNKLLKAVGEDGKKIEAIKSITKVKGIKNIIVNFDAASSRQFFEAINCYKLDELYRERGIETHYHLPLRDFCIDDDYKEVKTILPIVQKEYDGKDVKAKIHLHLNVFFDESAISKLRDYFKQIEGNIEGSTSFFSLNMFNNHYFAHYFLKHRGNYKNIDEYELHSIEKKYILDMFEKNFKNISTFQR